MHTFARIHADRLMKYYHCVLVLICVAGASCAGDRLSRTQPVVRDSAGITIIQSAEPLWNDRAWRVESPAILRIGASRRDDPHYLDGVVAAARLSDGSIAVAEASNGEISLFDTDGRLRAPRSRPKSAGFGRIREMVQIPGDSLVVFDPDNRRIAVVDRSGSMIRTMPWPDIMESGLVVGFLPPASIMALVRPSAMADGVDALRIPLDGSASHVMAHLSGDIRAYYPGLSPHYVVATAHNGFWFGGRATYEVGLFDSKAELRRLARLPYTPKPVSAEINRRPRSVAGTNGPADTAHAAVPPRDVLAPIVVAITDAEGNLWIRPTRKRSAGEWNVLDAEGRYLRDVELPDGFVPFQIGSDFILSRAIDETAAEFVVLYRLTKR